MPLPPDTVLAHAEGVRWRELEGKAVLLAPDGDTVHQLNESGTRFWKEVDGRRTIATIAEVMAEDYRVEHDRVLADVRQLGDELLGIGLVLVLVEVRA